MVSDLNLLGTGEQLDNSLNTILGDFRLLSQETEVLKPTATKMSLRPGEGTQKHITNYGRTVAGDLSDGVDITQAQTLSDTQTDYTPGEVGLQVILPGSTLRRSADRSLMRNTATMLNNAWQVKEDGDGAAQFSSFTPSIGGAAALPSPGHISAIADRLRIGNNVANPEPAPKPWHMAMHPLSAGVIRGRLVPMTSVPRGDAAFGVAGGAHAGITIPAGLDARGQNMLINGPGTIGTLEGLLFREDANISVSAADDAVNAGYSGEGFIYVSEVSPRLDPDRSDKSMRGAVEMNLWGAYAWGLYRPAAYGVQATFEAILPTS